MKRLMVVLVSLVFLFVGSAFAQQAAPAPAAAPAVSEKAAPAAK